MAHGVDKFFRMTDMKNKIIDTSFSYHREDKRNALRHAHRVVHKRRRSVWSVATLVNRLLSVDNICDDRRVAVKFLWLRLYLFDLLYKKSIAIEPMKFESIKSRVWGKVPEGSTFIF